jgi:hypothetical protein
MFLLLPGLACRPGILHSPDVWVLPFFRPSAQEHDQVSSIFPEADAVAVAIVDPQLQHTTTHTPHIGHVPLLQAGEGSGDPRGSTVVEVLKPLLEGAAAPRFRVLPRFDRDSR